MAPRLALLSLILAFGVSVAFATVTTIAASASGKSIGCDSCGT